MPNDKQDAVPRLDLAKRLLVLAGLEGGQAYADIRQRLAQEGVGDDQLPGDAALAHYRRGTEARLYREARREWQRRSGERRLFWHAVQADGGIDFLADLAVLETLEAILDLLRSASDDEDAGLGVADLVRLATTAAALKRVTLADAEVASRQQVGVLVDELAQARRDRREGVDLQEVADEMSRLLGVDIEVTDDNGEASSGS